MPRVLESNSDNFYLIGEVIEKINGEKLPSNNEVLSRFIHCRTKGQSVVAESLKECGVEVEEIWASANIPTHNHYRVLSKINSLYSKWTAIKKNKSRRSDKQRQLEETFSILLDKLFDISYNNSLNKMKTNEKERLAIGESVIRVADKPTERKEYYDHLLRMQTSHEKDSPQTEEVLPEDTASSSVVSTIHGPNGFPTNNEKNGHSSTEPDTDYFCFATDISLAATEFNSDDDDDESDEEYLLPNKYRKKTSKTKKTIMTPELSETLDRTKTSNRVASFILTLGAIGMGLNPENLVINRESIRQSRLNYSRDSAIQIRDNFNPNTPLVLHWDGKLLPNSNLQQKVDRIAVIVTGHDVSQTLGVPFLLQSATGKSQAELVLETVQKWRHVRDKIEFLCFDTTSVNSGRFEGTCVWLQKLMGKRMLWLACRHHVLELIVAVAFKTAFNEKSKSKNIQLFEEQFRNIWPNIDKSNYDSCVNDEEVLQHILPIKNDLVTFVNNQLLNFPQIRDDYKKLLMLTLLVIGEKAPDYKIGIVKSYVVHSCGALHRARWMAKLIYSMKIYLYRSQFFLTDAEVSALKQFIIFVLVVYIKNWYEAPSALKAAKNDMQLLKDISKFSAINAEISSRTMETFSRHLWYLSEELSGIAFFDNSLDVVEKRLMVKALKKPGSANPSVKGQVNVQNVIKYRISDFVTSNSLAIFRALNISQEFLSSDPETWANREDYSTARNLVKSLNVVNDVAERGVAKATEFNGQLTSDEDQWQYYLQGVEHHRKIYPNSNKATLLKGVEQSEF